MGMDVEISRVKDIITDSKKYYKIRYNKFEELNKNYEEFYKWEQGVFSLKDRCINRIICDASKNGDNVCFDDNESLILDKEDIENIIEVLKVSIKNEKYKDYDMRYTQTYEYCLEELNKILETTDFDKETLIYDMSC